MNHTQHINLSLNEAMTQFNKPHTKPLAIAFNAQRDNYITTSQAKLDNIIQTYQELKLEDLIKVRVLNFTHSLILNKKP